jgi:hypothetical protein
MNLSIVICLLYSTLDFSTLDICLNAIILLTIKRGFNYCYYQSCFLKCRSCSVVLVLIIIRLATY